MDSNSPNWPGFVGRMWDQDGKTVLIRTWLADVGNHLQDIRFKGLVTAMIVISVESEAGVKSVRVTTPHILPVEKASLRDLFTTYTAEWVQDGYRGFVDRFIALCDQEHVAHEPVAQAA